jgi:dihydropteroate synthase
MLLQLGERRFDVTFRPLVMGILNRTRDSFFDGGAYLALDALLRRAEELVTDGVDLLDIGAQAMGVGVERLSEAQESELVATTVEALAERFDVPLSVDTFRTAVVREAFAAGAVLGNDVSGFSEDGYLEVAAAAGASVVATHIRLPPGVPDPEPVYDDVVVDVTTHLERLVHRAAAAGLPAERVLVDPGLDLGKTWRQSVTLLAATDRFAALGHPVLVAASNKIFLGRLLDLPKDERTTATAAACTIAALFGARVLRVHDGRAGRQVADLCTAVLEERAG